MVWYMLLTATEAGTVASQGHIANTRPLSCKHILCFQFNATRDHVLISTRRKHQQQLENNICSQK